MYHYKAKITRVVDGDTFDVLIDLGFHVHFATRCRMLGINAPEMKGAEREAGIKSKAWLTMNFENQEVEIETHEQDKYGRWLVTLFHDGKNVNETMLELGLAKVYEL